MNEYDLMRSIGELDEKLLNRYDPETAKAVRRAARRRRLILDLILLLLLAGAVLWLILGRSAASADKMQRINESAVASSCSQDKQQFVVTESEKLGTGSEDSILRYIDPKMYENTESLWEDPVLQDAAKELCSTLDLGEESQALLFAEKLIPHLSQYCKEWTYLIGVEKIPAHNYWVLSSCERFPGGWCASYSERIDTSTGFEQYTELEKIEFQFSIKDSCIIVLFHDSGGIMKVMDLMTLSQDEIPASVPENPYVDVGRVLKYVDPSLYANPADQWFQDDSLQETIRPLSEQLKPDVFTSVESYAEVIANHLDPYLKEQSYLIEGVSCFSRWELRGLEQFEGGWCAWYWEVIDTSSGFEGRSESELFEIRYSLHDSAVVVLFSNDGHIITILDGMEYKPLSPISRG